ncbi:MAG: signal peptidase I [Sphingomonas sp.]|uniref:signal peptidase I n=1 Tax=Sphingomonas sp. TaxID=28214 RepID=UPI0025D0A0EA|nr:signal peptidase I [Sphingomonas sp.]MBX3563257.1 signal peptidase I [Sphingomonas sp.]
MRRFAIPNWLKPFTPWILLVLGTFTFQTAIAKPFYIPSESMMPALQVGDRLVVTKYPYGYAYSSLSIHGSGVVPGRLFGRLPERGDIVTVARRGDGADLIKRVIGLPGDTIALSHGQVILNGVAVPRVANGHAMIPVDANTPCDADMVRPFRRPGPDGALYCQVPLFRETLPNGASYDTIDLGDTHLPNGYLSPRDNFATIRVPEGHVFLMGDNRDQSADSRFSLEEKGLGGPVPLETISGRAEFVTHSYDGDAAWWNPVSWVSELRGGRAGTNLRPEHH